MAFLGTTQSIIDWGRLSIPDPKTRNKAVRAEFLGETIVATNSRETFILKRLATASPLIYVEPYEYSASGSIGAAAIGSKVFQYVAASQFVIFAKTSEKPTRPNQFKRVLANYEYTESLPFSYSDSELVDFLPAAVGLLNNTYAFSFTFSGSGSTFDVNASDDNQKDLIARALAISVRKSFSDEQKRRGLGIKFRGPLQSIDSVAQMKSYEEQTKELTKQLERNVDNANVGGNLGGVIIDIYAEDIVTT